MSSKSKEWWSSVYCLMSTELYGSSVISCMGTFLDKGWWDAAMPQCFVRLMPQLVPAEKGIIVEIIRAKQSATSLFGAHAKAGICPSWSMARTVAPRVSSTSTTVARPFLAAICRGVWSAVFVLLMRVGSSISAKMRRAHISWLLLQAIWSAELLLMSSSERSAPAWWSKK